MNYSRHFMCSLAFLCLLGGGASAWAQTDAEQKATVATTPATAVEASAVETPVAEAPASGSSVSTVTLPDMKSPDEEFGSVIKSASTKGRTLLNSNDIKNERDAVLQLERSVTGRENFDFDSISDYYTLKSCVERAIATQPAIKMAREKIIQAEAQYRQVQAGQNVKFNATNVTTYQSRPTVNGVVVTNPWQDVLQASISKVLTTFGHLENSIAASYTQIGVQSLEKMAAERSLAYNAKVAFLNRLKTDAIVDVALLHLGLTKESLADANKMYKQGVMARYDVIQSELQVVQAVENLADANTNVDKANTVLADLLSIERVDEPVNIGLEKPEPITVDEKCGLGDLKRLASQRRFELLALDRSVAVLELTRKAAESTNRPEVGLSGDYIFQPGVMGTPCSLFQLNLYINWAAWDGGERQAKLDEIDSQLRALRHERQELLDEISVAVEKAWLDFKLTDVIMRTAKKRVEAAWIFHDMSRQRFLNGLGTSLEVREALQSLNEAREAFVTACYDHDIAFAGLEHEVGVDFPNRRLAVTPEMMDNSDSVKLGNTTPEEARATVADAVASAEEAPAAVYYQVTDGKEASANKKQDGSVSTDNAKQTAQTADNTSAENSDRE